MDYIKELEEIVRKDVLVEVNDNLKEIEQRLQKKSTKEVKEELAYMKKVKLYFDEVIADIENNSITQEDAQDILEGLEDMRVENQDL